MTGATHLPPPPHMPSCHAQGQLHLLYILFNNIAIIPKKRRVLFPHFLKCVSDILIMFHVLYDQVLNEQMKNILHQMTSRHNVSECQVILM